MDGKLGMGWKPDKYDNRDERFGVAPVVFSHLPPAADLRPLSPKVYRQGKTNACVLKVISFLLHFKLSNVDPALIPDELELKINEDGGRPSTLFTYYVARLDMGEEDLDEGCTLRLAFKAVNTHGFCRNELLPFDEFSVRNTPPLAAYADAELRKGLIKYERLIQSADVIKAAIAGGHPVAFGAKLRMSFADPEVATTGQIPMPAPDEMMIGGHCMAIVGYDDAQQKFIVRNTWDETWGDKGHCYMPYDYVLSPDHCVDFWVMHLKFEVERPQSEQVAVMAV